MLKFKVRQRLADKEFQEGRKITLDELVEALNSNRATLSKMMNQRGVVVRTDVLDNLCRYFQCSIADLVEYVPDEAVQPGPKKGGGRRGSAG